MNQSVPLPLLLHEDTFYSFFAPYRHRDVRSNIWGGIGIQTFGEEFQLVLSLDSSFVWTVVDDGSSANQWITHGIHFVNRVCYLITEKPHNWLDVEFLIPSRPRSLTPIGLLRQMRKLERAMAEHHVSNPIGCVPHQ